MVTDGVTYEEHMKEIIQSFIIGLEHSRYFSTLEMYFLFDYSLIALDNSMLCYLG